MTQSQNPWVKTSPGRGVIAKTICFFVWHNTRERFTFGGLGIKECQRCHKCWECHLAPYSRSVNY